MSLRLIAVLTLSLATALAPAASAAAGGDAAGLALANVGKSAGTCAVHPSTNSGRKRSLVGEQKAVSDRVRARKESKRVFAIPIFQVVSERGNVFDDFFELE